MTRFLDPGGEFYISPFGGPEFGRVDFSPFAPGWSFSFQSAPATSWLYQNVGFFYFYEAYFGHGGSFSMTAPGSLTFTGVVTSGYGQWTCSGGGCEASVDAFFFGQWSNGQYASGEGGLVENLDFSPYVNLHTAITPEPAQHSPVWVRYSRHR